jgi:cell division protein FtsX
LITVKNKKAVRNLADKSFQANRTRNLIAIIAIALTAVPFTTLFTLGIGTVESLQQAAMRQAGGDGHAVLKYITDEEFNNVKAHPLIKEIAYNRALSDGVANEEFLKRRTEFWYYDDVGLRLGFSEPTSGHKPVAENEVIADTKTLQLLGVPLEIGAPLSLTIEIRGEKVQRDFVLAGWWESDPAFNVGQIFASRAYVDAHLDEAAAVSPVEAVRYTDGNTKQTQKQKISANGGKTPRMALTNLGRSKKRTVLVFISMSLSLILLNTVFTLSQSIDLDKFLSKFVDTDFLIAHADYFQSDFRGSENQTSESFIQAVEAQPGFEEGGRLYGGRAEMFAAEDEKNTTQRYNINAHGNFMAAVYGLEELPLERLELIDGELDLEKLATGNYILEGVHLDDNNVPQIGSAHFAVGETVTLHNYKGTSDKFANREYNTKKFTVLSHVAIKTYSNSDRVRWDYNFYLPADIYKTLVEQPAVMNYAFNVSESKEAEMERFLQSYTDTVEPITNYTSKFTSLKEFSGMRSTVVIIGGAISFVIGLIGILNFINTLLTSILTRRQEFAMLQSIGMTRKQLRSMLMYEGFYYALGTCILSLIFGTVFSLLIVKPFGNLLWFFSYQFILWPLLIVLPFLFALGVVIPLLSYIMTDRQSIVERLREAE